MNINKKRKKHKASVDSGPEKKTSTAGRIASTALVVALAAVTVAFSGMIGSSDDAELEKAALEDTRPAIEYVVELPEELVIGAQDEEEKKERKRSKLWSLVSLPLSFIGGALGLLLKPLLGKILFFAAIAAVLFGIFCLCLKILFPDKSLKELLTGRSILTFLCFTAVFIAAFNVPEIVRIDGETNHLMLLAAAAISTLTAVLLCKTEERKEQE